MQEDIELAPSQVESEISVRFMLDGGVITLGKINVVHKSLF